MKGNILKRIMDKLQDSKTEASWTVTSEKLTTIQIDSIYHYFVVKADKESLSPISHFTIHASTNRQDTNDYLKTPYNSLADSNGNFICQGKVYSNNLYVDIPIHSLGLDPSVMGKDTTIFFTVTLFNGDEVIESEVIPFKVNIRFFAYLQRLIEKPRFEDFKCLPILKRYTLKPDGVWTPDKTEFFKNAVAGIYNKELAESETLKQFMLEKDDTDEIFSIYRRRTLDDRVTGILIEAVIKALQLNNVMDIEKEIQGLADKIWIDDEWLKSAVTGLHNTENVVQDSTNLVVG